MGAIAPSPSRIQDYPAKNSIESDLSLTVSPNSKIHLTIILIAPQRQNVAMKCVLRAYNA